MAQTLWVVSSVRRGGVEGDTGGGVVSTAETVMANIVVMPFSPASSFGVLMGVDCLPLPIRATKLHSTPRPLSVGASSCMVAPLASHSAMMPWKQGQCMLVRDRSDP